MKKIFRVSFAFFLVANILTVEANELRSGGVIGRHIFGLATDVKNDPLLINEVPLIYEAVEFSKKLSFEHMNFVVSGFGKSVGGLYLTRYDDQLKQYIDTESFDLASVDGLSRPRGGVETPWNSVIFGETQLVDASKPTSFVNDFKVFFKGKDKLVDPFKYGWIAEAILLKGTDGDTKSKVIKDYAVGRVFAGQQFLMPDGKSLYLFDQDNAGMLYLYIAEKANSFTKGALYGISLESGKPVYELLGESSALKIKFKLKKIAFKDLFDQKPLAGGKCPAKYVQINSIYGEECLKVKKRNRKYAGLLDPIRMMPILRKGKAATRFTKVEFQDKQRVALTLDDGKSYTFRVVPGSVDKTKLVSQYLIQETVQ